MTRNRGLSTGGGASNFWICKTCSKKFTKISDQLMECEYCENHYCSTCLGMTDTEYEHHVHSSGMWFCRVCKPKVEETLKIEKEIEKRCQEHFEKYSRKLEQIEKVLQSKLGREEVVTLIEEKQEREKKVVTKQQEKQLIESVKKGMDTKSIADIVIEQLDKDSVNRDDVRVLIDRKFEENEKLASDRQSREKNVVIFRMDEPQTNMVRERQAKDGEVIKDMIAHMNIEAEQEVSIEKVIRLGGRGVNYKEHPRPVLVTFSNFDSKKMFLRRSNTLKSSENELFSKVSVANDLTKKDRERELELVFMKNQKNSEGVGPWKYVIRGPPGDRKLGKLRKMD